MFYQISVTLKRNFSIVYFYKHHLVVMFSINILWNEQFRNYIPISIFWGNVCVFGRTDGWRILIVSMCNRYILIICLYRKINLLFTYGRKFHILYPVLNKKQHTMDSRFSDDWLYDSNQLIDTLQTFYHYSCSGKSKNVAVFKNFKIKCMYFFLKAIIAVKKNAQTYHWFFFLNLIYFFMSQISI